MQPTKTATLYGGQITIDFYEDKHWYIRRGIRGCIPSVTGATGMIDKSRPLIYWAVNLMRDHLLQIAEKGETHINVDDIIEASKLHAQRKEQAATKGTMVHAWIEEYINAKLTGKDTPAMPKEQEILNGVLAFQQWEQAHNVEFIATEKIVYSKKHDYVGLMDCEAIIDDKRSVVDFKTSSGVYNEMRYQVAAYRAADEEETRNKYDGPNWIIRFDKDTAEFEVKEFNEQAKDFKAFLGALALKKRDKELSKK